MSIKSYVLAVVTVAAFFQTAPSIAQVVPYWHFDCRAHVDARTGKTWRGQCGTQPSTRYRDAGEPGAERRRRIQALPVVRPPPRASRNGGRDVENNGFGGCKLALFKRLVRRRFGRGKFALFKRPRCGKRLLSGLLVGGLGAARRTGQRERSPTAPRRPANLRATGGGSSSTPGNGGGSEGRTLQQGQQRRARRAATAATAAPRAIMATVTGTRMRRAVLPTTTTLRTLGTPVRGTRMAGNGGVTASTKGGFRSRARLAPVTERFCFRTLS